MKTYTNVKYQETEKGIWQCNVGENLSFFAVMQESYRDFPANGGLRFLDYQNEEAALEDARTLSQLMHQKHAIYNTGFCGAKIVANGKVNKQNKRLILETLGDFLNNLSGKIYTGCDLNTNLDDMNFLSEKTPYILSGLGTTVDTSSATAYGVFGSIQGAMGVNLEKYSFLVHGTGKTGSVVSTLLVEAGACVYTYDLLGDKSKIPGCIPVESDKWSSLPVDCMVLCSASKIISEDIAQNLSCEYIISGANNPFENTTVESILSLKDIKWIPDPISNAGAVISDSIEYYNSDKFHKAKPQDIYEFVRKVVYQKTLFFSCLYLNGIPKSKGVSIFSEFSDYNPLKCGMLFDFDYKDACYYNYHFPLNLLVNKKNLIANTSREDIKHVAER